MPEAQHTADIQLEKLLYRYSVALDAGDFDTVAQVLAMAEEDAQLERMLLELNRAYLEADSQAEMPPVQIPASQPDRSSGKTWARLRAWLKTGLNRIAQLLNFSQLRRINPGRLAAGLSLLALAVLILYGSASINHFFSQQTLGQVLKTVAVELPAAEELTAYPVMQRGGVIVTQAVEAMQIPALPQPTQAPQQPAFNPYPAPAGKGGGGVEEQPHLIVRNGYLTLVVSDTYQARDQAQQLVAQFAGEGAYVVSSTENPARGSQLPAISMQLRIPAERFETVMDSLAENAQQVLSRSESSQDVTAEYVDLSARLESMEAARQRLLEIMAKAEKTSDVLQVESLLAQRESEIEALKGRLQYLQGTARLSSIQLELQPSVLSQPLPPTGWRPAETARRAVEQLLERGQALVDRLITFSIATLPWLLLAGLVVAIAWRILRRPRAEQK